MIILMNSKYCWKKDKRKIDFEHMKIVSSFFFLTTRKKISLKWKQKQIYSNMIALRQIYFVNVIICEKNYQNVEEFVLKRGIAQLGT